MNKIVSSSCVVDLEKFFSYNFYFENAQFLTHVCFFFQIIFIIYFVIVAKFIRYAPIYEAFGFMDSQPMFIGLIILMQHILMPLNIVSTVLMAFYNSYIEC